MATVTATKKLGNWEPLGILIVGAIVAVIFRTLCFQPFTIPSPSMVPTLLAGDYIFVNKFAYGYSRYSLPFSPDLFSGRILTFREPERGEVVVYRAPSSPDVNHVRRVSGLPGERVGEVQIPPKHYYVTPDGNAEAELVPAENIVGRASFIVFSLGNNISFGEIWRWPSNMRWERLFKAVR